MKKLLSIDDYFKDNPNNQITELNLSSAQGYQIKELPDFEAKKHLLNAVEKIDLSDNVLAKLILRDFYSLMVVIATRNMLTEVNLNLNSLVELDLSYNMLNNIPLLTLLPSLEILNLTGNLIEKIDISNLIHVKQSLRELLLSFNRIMFESQAFISFIESLKHFQLESLSLEGNNFIESNPTLENTYMLYIVSSLKTLLIFNDEKIFLNRENINSNELTIQILDIDKSSKPNKNIRTISSMSNDSPTKKEQYSEYEDEVTMSDLIELIEKLNLNGGTDQNLIFDLFNSINKYMILVKSDNFKGVDTIKEEQNKYSFFLMNILSLLEQNCNIDSVLFNYIIEFSFIKQGIFSKLSFEFLSSLIKSSDKRSDLIYNTLDKVLSHSLSYQKFQFEILENLMNFTHITKTRFDSLYIILIPNVISYLVNLSLDSCFICEKKEVEEIKIRELAVCLDFIKGYLELKKKSIETNFEEPIEEVIKNKEEHENLYFTEFGGDLILYDSEDDGYCLDLIKSPSIGKRRFVNPIQLKSKVAIYDLKSNMNDTYYVTKESNFKTIGQLIKQLKVHYVQYYHTGTLEINNNDNSILSEEESHNSTAQLKEKFKSGNNLASIEEPSDIIYNISIISENLLDVEILDMKSQEMIYRLLFDFLIFKSGPFIFKIEYFLKFNKRLFILEKLLDLLKTLANSFDYHTKIFQIDPKVKDKMRSKIVERSQSDNIPTLLSCFESKLRPFIFNYNSDNTYIDTLILTNYMKHSSEKLLDSDNAQIRQLKIVISKIIVTYGSLLRITPDNKLKFDISKDLCEKILNICTLSNNDTFILKGCSDFIFQLLDEPRIIMDAVILPKIYYKTNDLKQLFLYMDINELKCKNMIDRLLKYDKIAKRVNYNQYESIKHQDLISLFVSITNVYKKISLLSLRESPTQDLSISINDGLIKSNIFEIFSEMLKIKNDELRLVISEFLYFQNHKNIKFKILKQITDIISKFHSVSFGNIETILSLIYLIFNKIALESNIQTEDLSVCFEAGKLALDFLIINTNRNPTKKEEVYQKNQLTSILTVYLNTISFKKDFVKILKKNSLDIIKSVLVNDSLCFNKFSYIPIEIERTQFGNYIAYLYDTTQNTNPILPYSWVYSRVIIKIADLMSNIKQSTYNIDYSIKLKHLVEKIFKEINYRVNFKIYSERLDWYTFNPNLHDEIESLLNLDSVKKQEKKYNKYHSSPEKKSLATRKIITLDNDDIINEQINYIAEFNPYSEYSIRSDL